MGLVRQQLSVGVGSETALLAWQMDYFVGCF